VAADLTQQANDSGQFEPMIGAAPREFERAGIDQQPEMVLADGGYWNTAQIAALGHQGLRVIVPTKSSTRTKARTLSPRQGPEAQRIDKVLDTPQGAALYRQGNTSSRPCSPAPSSYARSRDSSAAAWPPAAPKWQLIATGHNLLKLHTALTA
jgi:hypothetical protein